MQQYLIIKSLELSARNLVDTTQSSVASNYNGVHPLTWKVNATTVTENIPDIIAEEIQELPYEKLKTFVDNCNSMVRSPSGCIAYILRYEMGALCNNHPGIYYVKFDYSKLLTNKSRPQQGSIGFYVQQFAHALNAQYCSECGKFGSFTDGICSACLASMPKRIAIHGYHECATNTEGENTFTPMYAGVDGENRNHTLGIELEIVNNHPGMGMQHDGKINATDEFYNIRDNFVFENDGSVGRTGCEIISQPFTLEYMNQSHFIDILCAQAQYLHADDSDPSTGLHIHVSKKLLGVNVYEQAKTCLRILSFMNIYKDSFLKLSKRDPQSMYYCSFASASEIEEAYQQVKHYEEIGLNPFKDAENGRRIALLQNSHNTALNCRGGGDTIEFRIFKSTSDATRLKYLIYFVFGLAKSASTTKFEKCYCFSKMLKNIDDEVLKHFRKEGCFTKTVAIDNDHRGRAY
ncbi:MAG: amidoligase family protein [Bacilli bacterium]|nr:amidoligase family protein [Bacilli bacterium]